LNTQRRADRRRIHSAEVYDKYSVLPHQWCDYRALTGDKSDNIPGIRSIGDKTAARLLADGAHLEDLEKLDRLTGRTGALIRHQWDDASGIDFSSLLCRRFHKTLPGRSHRWSPRFCATSPR
jgi:5'-3' exonuclease